MEVDTSAESLTDEPSDGGASEPAGETETVEAKDPGDELTIKYVQGQITFEEYMQENELFHDVDEEEDEDDPFGALQPTDEGVAESAGGQSGEPGPSRSSRKRLPKPKVRRPRRLHTRLNKYLQGLMGEANLTFARGKRDSAILMCMEVIRQAPRAPEPFQTLSLIYEESCEYDKSVQYLLIAAHLAPSDADQWIKLADIAIEHDKLRDATTYYTKAIAAQREHIQLHWERAKIYMQLGDKDKAVRGYVQILALLEKAGSAESYFQLSREIMKIHHENSRIAEAIEAMDRAFTKFPQQITSEDVNVVVELHMSRSLFGRALEVLVDTCGVTVTGRTTGDDHSLEVVYGGGDAINYLREHNYTAMVRVEAPEAIAIDLRVKLAISLIRLKLSSLCQELIAPLLDESVDNMGDLYLDLAEAYMEMRECALAKPILATLVTSETYNLAAVWFLYGECLNALNDLSNAAEAFKKVVESAPQHFGARMALSAIQQQMGKPEEALRALTQELGKEGDQFTSQDMRLLLHKCLLLHSQGNLMEFITLSKKILYSRFRSMLQDPTHISMIMSYRSRKHRNFALRQFAERDESAIEHENAYQEAMSVVHVDDIWELYLKVCETMIDMAMYQDLEDLSIVALTVPQFSDDKFKSAEAEFICLIAFILNKSGSFAFNFIKQYVIKDESNRAWNLISQIISMMEDHRHNRFLMRLQLRNPDNLGLGILNGHQSMVSSNFKYALGEYVAAFQKVPHDPMISLCIGLVFINLVSGKLAKKRHILVQQGCAFLNQYVELRGECQEAYYNLGRAMHQLGLFHAAVHYYERGLALPPAIQGEESHLFDLTKELAHNLRLIYKNSKSRYMARMIAEKYLVV